MREAGAGHEKMRGILVIDGREYPARGKRGRGIDLAAKANAGDHLRQGNAGFYRLLRELAGRAHAVHQPRRATVVGDHRAGAVVVAMLQQPEGHCPRATATGGFEQ